VPALLTIPDMLERVRRGDFLGTLVATIVAMLATVAVTELVGMALGR
jgi:hypothetical protein